MAPIKHNLVALGSAAVLAVYAAGYSRTRAAAQRFATESADRRPQSPSPPMVAPPEIKPEPKAEPIARDTTAKPAAPPRKHAAAPSHSADTTTRPADTTPSTPKAVAAETVAAPVVAPPATPKPDSSAKVAAAQPTDSAAQPTKERAPYKDGTYSGWGTSRHGDIEASVLIKDGRIAAAIISQCLTRYSCSWISELPGQVVTRQSPEVDIVSGATQSTNAFYYAVVEALKKAK
jgi:uncharacterized protein with FMN-binding domain